MVREQRKLAAVLAADVVGYSRLMGRDESGTLARLREHRRSRFEPTLARYGGRLVKLMGDGALAEFASACDALSAAIEFQQAVNEVDSEGFHRTPTVDYVYVLDGPVELVLDDTSVVVEPGDCVVQRGTNHAWRNHGTEPIRLLAVMIGV